MANHEANGKKAKPDILAQRLRQVLWQTLRTDENQDNG